MRNKKRKKIRLKTWQLHPRPFSAWFLWNSMVFMHKHIYVYLFIYLFIYTCLTFFSWSCTGLLALTQPVAFRWACLSSFQFGQDPVGGRVEPQPVLRALVREVWELGLQLHGTNLWAQEKPDERHIRAMVGGGGGPSPSRSAWPLCCPATAGDSPRGRSSRSSPESHRTSSDRLQNIKQRPQSAAMATKLGFFWPPTTLGASAWSSLAGDEGVQLR